jgi:hypothetical protein
MALSVWVEGGGLGQACKASVVTLAVCVHVSTTGVGSRRGTAGTLCVSHIRQKRHSSLQQRCAQLWRRSTAHGRCAAGVHFYHTNTPQGAVWSSLPICMGCAAHLPSKVGAGGVNLVQLRPVVIKARQQQRHAKGPHAARLCSSSSSSSSSNTSPV